MASDGTMNIERYGVASDEEREQLKTALAQAHVSSGCGYHHLATGLTKGVALTLLRLWKGVLKGEDLDLCMHECLHWLGWLKFTETCELTEHAIEYASWLAQAYPALLAEAAPVTDTKTSEAERTTVRLGEPSDDVAGPYVGDDRSPPGASAAPAEPSC